MHVVSTYNKGRRSCGVGVGGREGRDPHENICRMGQSMFYFTTDLCHCM